MRKQAGRLSPCKMNIFRFLPLPIMTIMLAVTFESSFGDKFMYQHARKAPDEMRELQRIIPAFSVRQEVSLVEGMKELMPVYCVIGKIPAVRNISNKIIVLEKRGRY